MFERNFKNSISQCLAKFGKTQQRKLIKSNSNTKKNNDNKSTVNTTDRKNSNREKENKLQNKCKSEGNKFSGKKDFTQKHIHDYPSVTKESIAKAIDDYRIQLEQRKEEIRLFLNQADLIRDILIGENVLTQDVIRNELQTGATLLHNASDFVMLLFDEDPYPEFNIPIDVIESDVSHLLQPSEFFNISDFNLKPILKLAISPKIRYLPNWNVKRVYDKLSSFKEMKIDPDTNVELRVMSGITAMFSRLSVQHRFGSYESHILSCFLMKQKFSEKDILINLPDDIPKSNKLKRGVDTVCWQYLKYVLKHYNGIPFYSKKYDASKVPSMFDVGIELVSEKAVSCCLPGVLHGLLNGIIAEILGDLTATTALMYAKHLFFCSATSVYQTQLKYKSDSRSWVKLVYDKIGYVLVNSYSTTMRPIEQKIECIDSEFWADDDERENLLKSLLKLPSHFKQFALSQLSYVSKRSLFTSGIYKQLELITDESLKFSLNETLISECSKSTEYLRWLTMTMSVVSNFGLYNKTSLLLEYEKSIATQQKVALVDPKIKVALKVGDTRSVPLIYDWTDTEVLNELSDLFDELWSDSIISNFNRIKNFEERFVTFLTNKSGGIKSEEPTLSKSLQGISNARIISFALNRNSYTNESKFMKMLVAKGKCAIRFQIDRRARVIVIVPNAVQTNEVFLLLAFNCIKSDKDLGSKIAVGKQIGNLLDASLQLVQSGDVNAIKNSGDMKGMDAHTVPSITKFLRYKVIETMTRLDPTGKVSQYFFSADKEYTLAEISTEMSSSQFETLTTTYNRFLRGVVVHSAKVMANLYSLTMHLEDNFFAEGMDVSDQTFQSGFFGTSAQHTLLLTLLMINLEKQFFSIMSNRQINLIHKIMGDDLFEVIKNGCKYPDIAKLWLKKRNQALSKINYEEDLGLSRIYGAFLQQAALLGVYVPFPARISLFCDERSETMNRHPLDVIKIVLDLLGAKSQRSYGIDNAISIGYSIWNAHRTSRYLTTEKEIQSLNKLTNTTLKMCEDVITFKPGSNSCRMLYPFVLIMCRPIGWPMLSFKMNIGGEEMLFRHKAVTTLAGDGAMMLINQMFFTNTEVHMFNIRNFKTDNELIVKLKAVKDFLDWENRHAWGFTYSEHLMEFKRLRHLTESRKEELGADNIEVMVYNLNRYLDYQKLINSREATEKLETNGVKIPHSMLYVNHNRTKIEQSLTVKSEKLEERAFLDTLFFRHISKYSIVPSSRETLQLHTLTAVRIRVRDYDYDKKTNMMIVPSLDALLNIRLPVMPGYHLNSSYARLLRYTTFPELSDTNLSGVIGEITGRLGASLDVEAAIEFGSYVRHKDPSLVRDAGIAMGIPQSYLEKFEYLVKSFSSENFNLKYHSIFNNVRHFCISANLHKFEAHGLFSDPLINMSMFKTVTKFHRIFTRDFIFSYVDELHDRFVYLDYSIYSLLTMISKGAIKYLGSHVDRLFGNLLPSEFDLDEIDI